MSSFVAPTTVAAALSALADDPAAVPVAGGTDLLPRARAHGEPLPRSWVSLHAIPALAGIESTAQGGIRIGAGATHGQIAASALVRSGAPTVATASGLVGGPATRSVATLGGNLANGSPAMDLGAPLLVHDARAELVDPQGSRLIALADLFVGPGVTALRRGELLMAVELPPAGAATSAYVRHGARAAMEVTVAGAAVLVERDEDGVIARARIALTAVGPTCFRIRGVERLLRGVAPDNAAVLDEVADAAAELAEPIDDHRAPARYRRALVAIAVGRALREALR